MSEPSQVETPVGSSSSLGDACSVPPPAPRRRRGRLPRPPPVVSLELRPCETRAQAEALTAALVEWLTRPLL